MTAWPVKMAEVNTTTHSTLGMKQCWLYCFLLEKVSSRGRVVFKFFLSTTAPPPKPKLYHLESIQIHQLLHLSNEEHSLVAH